MSVDTLVFGGGWLGHQFVARMQGAKLSTADIADADAVAEALDEADPVRAINCAGRTGEHNIDSLEREPARTYRSNVLGPIVIAEACLDRNIHMTHLGSGCIYEGDAGGEGFTEDDPPNFRGSLYAVTKIVAEDALRDLDALQLRIRLPMASEPAPRNLLTKLLAFDQVVGIANSITILDDFWLPAMALIERKATGVWNMVNDGVERHDELLAWWQEHVDAEHTFEVITPEVLDRRLAARRSNCLLSSAKLKAAGLAMPHVDEALPRLLRAYAAKLREASGA